MLKNKKTRTSDLEGRVAIRWAMPSPGKYPGLYSLCLKRVGEEALTICWGTWLYNGLLYVLRYLLCHSMPKMLTHCLKTNIAKGGSLIAVQGLWTTRVTSDSHGKGHTTTLPYLTEIVHAWEGSL